MLTPAFIITIAALILMWPVLTKVKDSLGNSIVSGTTALEHQAKKLEVGSKADLELSLHELEIKKQERLNSIKAKRTTVPGMEEVAL